MISDFVLTWTHKLSQLLLMPRIISSPMDSFGFSVFYTIWRDSPENVTGDENLTVGYLGFIEYRRGDPDWELFRSELLESLGSCWGLMINTSSELEGAYLDHLRKEMGSKRLWAVGPLLPEDYSVDHLGQRGGPSSMPILDVLTWLDKWQDNSVVYVCFGTHAVMTHKQKDVLAIALEISEVRFIWRFRDQGAIDEDQMVDEFKGRVGERGLVIKGWTPHVVILKHPAVGVFVAHCGWNSIIEGIDAGMRMIA
ncbi:UDP-glucuronosyl/UDP-glucosyltransferase [Dillenia turbinata]|uniref:UDP-glucuronosyl/UDP-glucosyltransferase n=1 Tax=Dillenia turbinata TaxID=194707 RepID=A0AAN8UUT4_9MAGN